MSEQNSSVQESVCIIGKSHDPRLEAIEDEIAELVAEALFNHLLKHGRIPCPSELQEPPTG